MTDTPINRRAGAHVQIWAFIVALAIASIGSRVLALSGQSAPHPDGVTVPWWALAAAFAVGESFALHIHFRSNSGSFSLHEIPLVVGLIYTDPADLWLAVLLGTAIGLTLSRRQPAMKLAFNVSNVSLRVVVAWAMFQWIVGSADPLSRSGWAAIALAVVASSILEVAMMLTAVAITERDIRGQRFMGVFAFGVATGLTTAVQAMIALIVLRADAAGIVLIGCSTLVLWAAYRAYGNERATRERIEFLHQSTRSLRNNSATADAVGVLLDEAVEMFRARRAEFFLFPGVDSDEPPAYFERDREISSVRALDEKEASRGAALAAAIATPVLATPRQCPNDLIADHLAAHDIEDAMFGVLRSDERSLGVLIVANRLGTISTFDTEDLRLFESLIDHASVALENDRLGQALSDLRSVEQVLAHQAQYDSLTGLANRALFTERLAAALADEEPIAVLFVDLDDFKLVNDTLGHATGDRLLVEVAERLEAVTRSDDLAARLGGDEFALLIGSAIDPLEVANRLIGALSTQFLFGTNEVRIGASVGVARSTHADGSASAILQQADLAMYAAKDRGKGSVVEYSDELQDEALGKQRLQTSLRRAITEEQFDVHYQPIVRLHDQHIVGAEALVRWRQDSGRLLKPEVFIMEAERTGLLTSIDRQVREMVLTGLGELTIAAGGAFFASLNVSPQQLHDGDFVPNLVRDIGAARVSPESLVLEITESSFIRDTDEASAKLERVRALGIRFALDDFGTGYSALSVVRRLPLDILKVAQPFVADLSDEKNRAFVEAIMKLSHTMGLTVVAEGVETESALEALRDLECDLAQGYLFARPMPHAQLVRAITAQQSDLIAPSIETAT